MVSIRRASQSASAIGSQPVSQASDAISQV